MALVLLSGGVCGGGKRGRNRIHIPGLEGKAVSVPKKLYKNHTLHVKISRVLM
jgi:hypothetical protein